MKETAVQRLSGKRRKVIVDREEMMYIPLLETLQTLLRNVSVLKEVSFVHDACAIIIGMYTTCSLVG